MSASEQFPKHPNFFKNPDDLDRAIANISTTLNLNPDGWHQLQREIIPYLLDHHGLMTTLAKDNQFLTQIISDFLLGNKRVLVAGGSPGNGKSLLVTEIRKYHDIFSNLDPSLNFPLAFIPWDKTRQMFYLCIGSLVGKEVKPPAGVAPTVILRLISEVITDTCLFVVKHYPDARVLVEVPMSGNRGEQVVYELDNNRIPHTVLAMHSPAMENEILHRGHRDSKNSGQPPAMLKIRSEILEKMVGSVSLQNKEEEDEVIFHFWQLFMVFGRQGNVVTWDPNTDRDAFEQTRQEYQVNDAKPDDILPFPLLPYIRSQFEARLSLLPKAQLDAIIKLAGG